VHGRVLIAGLAGGVAALVAIHLLLFNTYWNYSEGVYALTAHLMLHGGDLYARIVGAQPPGVFLVGVVLLAIHNSLEWLRFAVGCLQLGAGLIAAQIVYRVTGSAVASVLTPAAMLLTPWAVHEHGALTPEIVVLPVMLGAALLSADRRYAALTGVLCGVLPLVKFPFAIPAVVLVALSADVRRTATWAIATLIAGFAAVTLAAGSEFWRDTLIAQLHTGARSIGALKGFWAQAVWNVLGLLFCSVVALRLRAAAVDKPLLRTTTALAVANLVTFLTNFKQGTGLNVTVTVEASLVPLAACGTVFAVRASANRAGRAGRAGRADRASGSRWLAAACSLAVVFTLAQSISLIASPNNPVPFLRAGSRPAWEILMTGPQLRAAVKAARSCPPGAPYGGPPLIALMAGRSLPDDQPDQFLPAHSSTLSAIQAKIAAVHGVCI
jgi:hypothetical protein